MTLAADDKTHENLGTDTGLFCTLMMAALHGIAADEAQLRHEFGSDPLDDQHILLAAKRLGLSAKLVQQPKERLDRVPYPAIAIDKDGHYFIVGGYDANSTGEPRVLIHRAGESPSVLALDDFLKVWSGSLIFCTSKANFSGETAKFDFSWFVPVVVKYHKLLGEVLLVSLVLQIIGLITPMFFQVVMDKVLVNHAMKTLNVIAIGLAGAIVFEIVLAAIRTWVFAHTSSKIDVELGARLFRHLLSLPLAYFQSRRVGDSVARVRELENIRSFLTGNAMTVVLDVLFSFVFLAVMLWYSVWLTLIVVASIPLYIALSVLCTPIIRARLDVKFNRGAENQSFLVETVSGIDTVKAMAVEPGWTKKWGQQLASYVAAGLSRDEDFDDRGQRRQLHQ